MKTNDKLLQFNIIIGYIIVLSLICSVIFVLFHERDRMKTIGQEAQELRMHYRDINTIHSLITEQALWGESIIGWKEKDGLAYQERRSTIDSLLQKLKKHCKNHIDPKQIDTLQNLLVKKEKHLLYIREIFLKQDSIDSLMIHRLPIVAKQTVRTKTVTRKKKGIAGWFGKKETLTIPSPVAPLYELNDQLVDMQKAQIKKIDFHIDSLARENEILNDKLVNLISVLDNQVQKALQEREQKIDGTRWHSFQLIAYLAGISLILLLISYCIIQKELRAKAAGQRKQQQLLEEYNDLLNMRNKIILTVTHDIRGPLNIIGNYVNWITETENKSKQDFYLQHIHSAYKHILQLINNLLDVYRLNASKETRNDTSFHLNSLLKRIASKFFIQANGKGLLLLENFNGTDVQVYGDAERLEQIIDNLLANAIKFTDKGSISYNANHKNDMLYLEIQDTGIGMDEEMVKRIFNPFEKAATERTTDGFGLGLSIVKGLVQLLDGAISVKSQLGKGTTFYLNLPLPLSMDESNKRNERQEAVLSSGCLPQTILVIDDDTMQLALYQEMLERNGIRCETCSHVQDLVGMMRKQNYDMLLTDIQMSKTSGFELLELLRNSHIGNSQTIPIVAMTARGENDIEILLKAGFSGCIHKPFSEQELLQVLSQSYQLKKEKKDIDFSSLVHGTNNKQKILAWFVLETRKNIEELEKALKNKDIAILTQIVHRMSPLWELLHKEKVLTDFRNILHDNLSDEIINSETNRIIDFCKQLIQEGNKELYKNEKDIDS